uniref:Uncharacterized protein n=1 Tax=Echinococcus canadensis TaxID=519352 RepID=A0A915EXM7_9CEST
MPLLSLPTSNLLSHTPKHIQSLCIPHLLNPL